MTRYNVSGYIIPTLFPRIESDNLMRTIKDALASRIVSSEITNIIGDRWEFLHKKYHFVVEMGDMSEKEVEAYFLSIKPEDYLGQYQLSVSKDKEDIMLDVLQDLKDDNNLPMEEKDYVMARLVDSRYEEDGDE